MSSPGKKSEPAEQGGQQGLLGMETVFGLVEHPAGGPIDDAGTDLLTAMGRQAMQHDGARIGRRQQRFIEAEACKGLLPLPLFLLLAHRGPDIGVQGVGATHAGHGIGGQLKAAATRSQGPGLLQHG